MNLSLGFGLDKYRVQQGALLNQNYTPEADSDVNLLLSDRSGLTLVDTLENDATIQPSYFYKYDTLVHAKVVDNGALDIGENDFTLCGWIKGYTKTDSLYLLGKNIAGSVAGRYGISYNKTTGYITGIAQSSGGTVVINSVVDITTGWHFILLDINQATKKVRLFIDNAQIGTDSTFSGTFTALGNQYEFYFGAGNAADGSTSGLPARSSHSDTHVFNKLLTPTEQTTLYNRGYVDGAKASFACSNASSGYLFDSSGNNYHATIVSTGGETVFEGYDSTGSRYLLDKGYTLFSNGINKYYLPLTFAGAEITPPTLTGYSKVRNYLGNASKHNLANSRITFVSAQLDRSSKTAYYDTIRNAFSTKYDILSPTTFHIEELHQYNFNNHAKDAYKGRNFVKRDGDYLIMWGVVTNKTGNNLINTLKYTGDYNTAFITTWDTEKAGSATKTIVIPTTGSGYDCDIDFDGIETIHYSGSPGNITYVFPTTGIKTIRITGTFPRIYFNGAGDCLKLMTIKNWGSIAWSTMSGAFSGCSNLTGRYTDSPNLSAVTSMEDMFYLAYLFNSPVNGNTGNVTNIMRAFGYNYAFNQSVNYDTSKVTAMTNLFYNCFAFNQDIRAWDVRNVTAMVNMLYGARDFSTPNYDALLIAWSTLPLKSNVVIAIPETHYSLGAAKTAKDLIVSTYNWTITDGGEKFDNGKLILTLDDQATACFTNAYPILVTKGVKATFYICTDNVGQAGYASWANIQTMNGAGMDIQCHSKSHPNLTTLTEAQIDTELEAVNTAFAANSLPAPRHHAYPAGFYNANVKTYIAEWRDTGRTTDRGYMLRNSDKFALKCNYTEAQAELNVRVEQAKILLDNAKESCKAVSLISHGVGGNSSQISIQEYTDIITYAQLIGVDILSIEEYYALL